MKEQLEEIIESIENTLFMVNWPTSHLISKDTHLKWCVGQLENVKKNFRSINRIRNYVYYILQQIH